MKDHEHCCVRGCKRETGRRKPYCLAHLDRLPYVRALKADRAPTFIAGPIDGYLRLLERIGLVKLVRSGTKRVAVWQMLSERALRPAS
jgi:hypothetical protein